MKRLIRASNITTDVIFEDENFEFLEHSGVEKNDTYWSNLQVETKEGSLADKHEVIIHPGIVGSGMFEKDGTPYYAMYRGCYVQHGVRRELDTLDETREYIGVLEDAVDFSERVNDWLYKHDRMAN